MDTFHSKAQNLSTLFYYNISETRNKELRKALKEYSFLLTLFNLAIQHFQNENFEKFDSLVGENACQIRAIRIAFIASENQLDIPALAERIEHVHSKVKESLTENKINRLMSSNITLQELLETENLNILLSPDEMFIFLSFVLSEMKEPQPKVMLSILQSEKSTPRKLKSLTPDVSSHFIKSTASKMRRLLAEASIHFVRKIAWESKDTHLMKMVSNTFTKEHNSWPCIPMFWAYKILLSAAHKRSIPLIVHAKFVRNNGEAYEILHEEALLFKPQKHTRTKLYIQTEPTTTDASIAACVIQGVVCLEANQYPCIINWKKQLLRHSIVDIILAGAADHRQYPNPYIAIPCDDAEYENYKTMAQHQGFCLNNPTLFFINHVYSKQIGKVLSLISEGSLLLANS